MPYAPRSMIAQSTMFKELRDSVAAETTAFTFACGGAIPIVPSLPEVMHSAEPEDLRSTSCLPIDLRWDPKDPATQASQTKLTFPLEPSIEGNLAQLIRDMAPATFGLGGNDVFDESYRKAAKLDPTKFSSTFNPYELGIVDAVAQALLPSLRHSKQTRSVKAELYKLNLYSGPSGKFKSHVDTPRSPAQFGSLVVCFPLQFKGGALEVRHQGKTVTFDWSSTKVEGGNNRPAINWAAFYSDCEHEIFEVTEGHRLTLTYNLYSVRGNGQLGGNYPWLDPTQLPLYKTIHDLVHYETAWANGGLIGYNCSHVYPHTTPSKLNFLAPDNLKGADMLMFEIFKSLGLKVDFRPVVNDGNFESDNGDKACPIIGRRLQFAMWGAIMDEEAFEAECDHWDGRPSPSFIDFRDVHWLNDFTHEEPQLSWITYGNAPSSIMTYSCMAMIVEIPPTNCEGAAQ
ncbi:Fe2OG dioxygenase domain-containing protein [Madurella fahalii]|uniref:Fe2OG dioxygenase domain-containing protein n=1 Tax=Madurella fahalii TaxID=1157608 RepID=A0ABQ0GEJ1_9PEZI